MDLFLLSDFTTNFFVTFLPSRDLGKKTILIFKQNLR